MLRPSGLQVPHLPSPPPPPHGGARSLRTQPAEQGPSSFCFVKLLWTNVQHSITRFVNRTRNNSWQANGIFFSLRNETRKSASDFSTVGENKNKNKQVTPGHLLPKPITASALLLVKCWSYQRTPGPFRGAPGRGQEPGGQQLRKGPSRCESLRAPQSERSRSGVSPDQTPPCLL